MTFSFLFASLEALAFLLAIVLIAFKMRRKGNNSMAPQQIFIILVAGFPLLCAAVFTPNDLTELKAAVSGCASTCSNQGDDISVWDISKVTSF